MKKHRRDYLMRALSKEESAEDPIEQFRSWFNDAVRIKAVEPNAFTLATAGERPSARILLLKNYSAAGFVFYTNYLSRKGKDLERNPYACMLFYWPELERQVRIEGAVAKVEKARSDRYFAARPLGAQAGSAASVQSSVIESREVLDAAWEKIMQDAKGGKIKRPPDWGGYILKPNSIEFWQGRQNRLHDRILYTRENGDWLIERLAP